MNSSAAGSTPPRRPDFVRITIFALVMLAVATPAAWQVRRSYSDIEHRQATLVADAQTSRFIARFLPLIFDLQHLRSAAAHPRSRLQLATIAARLSIDAQTLDGPGSAQQIHTEDCHTTLAAWHAKIIDATHTSENPPIQRAINVSNCLVNDAATASELGYDDDKTVQVLTSLVGLNVPGMIRRLGLSATQMDAGTSKAFNRKTLVSISRLLGTVSKFQRTIEGLVDQDEPENDRALARELDVFERPEAALEERFESASDALLIAPTTVAGASQYIDRQALAVIDALQPLAARSTAEMNDRIGREAVDTRTRGTRLIVIACLGVAIALAAITLAAQFLDRRHARELRRIEGALADQLARAAAERTLSLTEGQFRAVFDSSAAAIAIFDDRLDVVQANRTFAELRARRLDVEAVLGSQVRSVFTSVAAPSTAEVQLGATPETRQYFNLTLAAVFAEDSCVYVIATLTDITDAKANEERLRNDSRHDALTQLMNRKGFEDEVTALNAGTPAPLAVAFIDLDGFKPINDRYGHATGDAVLRAIGARLRGVVAFGDAVARLGGDEFALIIRDVADEPTAIAIAQRILAAIAVPISVESGIVNVCASIGIALDRAPEPSRDLADLLASADAAMYKAKVERTGYALAAAAIVA